MRRLPGWAGFLAVAAVAAGASPSFGPGAFRFARSVAAPPGWCRLDLPDDVLDACRPGLPDLRLTGTDGNEIPYSLSRGTSGERVRLELTDVESTPGRETTARLDRGAQAPLARAAEIEISEREFLKPVVLEDSEDGRTFREIARGSVFAVASQRSLTLRFPANDRRYWRLRFDDRNGEPIHPTAVRIEPAGAPTAPRREIALTLGPAPEGGSIAARLPAANLGVVALRLAVDEPAYNRRVHVFERVFFRDEVSRRLIGSGTIRRAPDGASENEIPLCDPSTRDLEIEFENGDSPALAVSGVTALAQPPGLLFFSTGGTATLFYGSPSVSAPRYDLDAAFVSGSPRNLATASLGDAREVGHPLAVAPAPRGAPLEANAWAARQAIVTPGGAGVAYLDLPETLRRQLSALRIVDAENRPVAYLVETGARHAVHPAALELRQDGSRSVMTLVGLDPENPPDAIVLNASGPDYFSRDAVVWEEKRDARGSTGRQFLGSAHWERKPGERIRPLTIAISPPSQKSLAIEIENGDNAALAVTRADVRIPFARIDFVSEPSEKLWLLSENPDAPAARFDLAMLADRVLTAPASPATLLPAQRTQGRAALPRWFWVAVAGAAVLVLAALARTLKAAETL